MCAGRSRSLAHVRTGLDSLQVGRLAAGRAHRAGVAAAGPVATLDVPRYGRLHAWLQRHRCAERQNRRHAGRGRLSRVHPGQLCAHDQARELRPVAQPGRPAPRGALLASGRSRPCAQAGEGTAVGGRIEGLPDGLERRRHHHGHLCRRGGGRPDHRGLDLPCGLAGISRTARAARRAGARHELRERPLVPGACPARRLWNADARRLVHEFLDAASNARP
jgi:hypothetical protein